MNKIIKINLNNINSFLEIGKNNFPCILYGIHKESFVWICEEKKNDENYIKEQKIKTFFLDNCPGSTIVCSKGDIDLGFFGDEEFCKKQLNKIINLFSKKITNLKFLNNDFIYNNNKYGAATFLKFDECCYIGVHISNNINSFLIAQICQKRSFTMPEKLPSPITENEIIELFKEN